VQTRSLPLVPILNQLNSVKKNILYQTFCLLKITNLALEQIFYVYIQLDFLDVAAEQRVGGSDGKSSDS
jgi:hypothetical protein